jgi:tRNA threonylcarbamoyladenosine biosynthesis protein TsaB
MQRFSQSQKIILGFDVSHGHNSAAISVNDKIIAFTSSDILITSNERIFNMIENVLSSAKLTLGDLDYIATSNGPGSFTGIRVGLSAILGLSIALDIKPIILNNFEIMHSKMKEQSCGYSNHGVIIDAARGQFYVQIFEEKSFSQASIFDYEAIKKLLIHAKNIVISGSGAVKFRDLSNVSILPRFGKSNAKMICKLAYSKLLDDSFTSDITPLYIRLPDAKKVKIDSKT